MRRSTARFPHAVSCANNHAPSTHIMLVSVVTNSMSPLNLFVAWFSCLQKESGDMCHSTLQTRQGEGAVSGRGRLWGEGRNLET